jgi:glycerophosphoryl diester phosphodiesterase
VRIPRLTEVLDVLRPHPVELLLEIKPPATLEQVKNIVGQVAEVGLSSRTVVQSFDPAVVALVRDAAPELRRGLLRDGFDADQVAVARELGIGYCNPSTTAVLGDPDTVAALAGAGVAVMPWTANDLALWPALLAAGVAGLISDRTGELTGWATARGPV